MKRLQLVLSIQNRIQANFICQTDWEWPVGRCRARWPDYNKGSWMKKFATSSEQNAVFISR